MIEAGLQQFLAADFNVSALVGPRIYGVMLPKDFQLPAVVFSTVAYRPVESLRGPNISETRRFQFDCYSNNFLGSHVLSRAVRNALCPPDANGDPQSLKTTLPDGSGVDSTQVIIELDKPFQIGPGNFVFCAVLDVEISFVNQSS